MNGGQAAYGAIKWAPGTAVYERGPLGNVLVSSGEVQGPSAPLFQLHQLSAGDDSQGRTRDFQRYPGGQHFQQQQVFQDRNSLPQVTQAGERTAVISSEANDARTLLTYAESVLQNAFSGKVQPEEFREPEYFAPNPSQSYAQPAAQFTVSLNPPYSQAGQPVQSLSSQIGEGRLVGGGQEPSSLFSFSAAVPNHNQNQSSLVTPQFTRGREFASGQEVVQQAEQRPGEPRWASSHSREIRETAESQGRLYLSDHGKPDLPVDRYLDQRLASAPAREQERRLDVRRSSEQTRVYQQQQPESDYRLPSYVRESENRVVTGPRIVEAPWVYSQAPPAHQARVLLPIGAEQQVNVVRGFQELPRGNGAPDSRASFHERGTSPPPRGQPSVHIAPIAGHHQGPRDLSLSDSHFERSRHSPERPFVREHRIVVQEPRDHHNEMPRQWNRPPQERPQAAPSQPGAMRLVQISPESVIIVPAGVDPLEGFIFGCNNRTKMECFRRQLFALPASNWSHVQKLAPGSKLFLFNFDSREMYGVFEAASMGQMNIEPDAFAGFGAFPAQVRIRCIEQCPPLPEALFKPAIQENYFSAKKFNYTLSAVQVERLMGLFLEQRLAPGGQSAVLSPVDLRYRINSRRDSVGNGAAHGSPGGRGNKRGGRGPKGKNQSNGKGAEGQGSGEAQGAAGSPGAKTPGGSKAKRPWPKSLSTLLADTTTEGSPGQEGGAGQKRPAGEAGEGSEQVEAKRAKGEQRVTLKLSQVMVGSKPGGSPLAGKPPGKAGTAVVNPVELGKQLAELEAAVKASAEMKKGPAEKKAAAAMALDGDSFMAELAAAGGLQVGDLSSLSASMARTPDPQLGPAASAEGAPPATPSGISAAPEPSDPSTAGQEIGPAAEKAAGEVVPVEKAAGGEATPGEIAAEKDSLGEGTKTDSAKVDSVKSDLAQVDSVKPDATQVDSAISDSVKVDPARVDSAPAGTSGQPAEAADVAADLKVGKVAEEGEEQNKGQKTEGEEKMVQLGKSDDQAKATAAMEVEGSGSAVVTAPAGGLLDLGEPSGVQGPVSGADVEMKDASSDAKVAGSGDLTPQEIPQLGKADQGSIVGPGQEAVIPENSSPLGAARVERQDLGEDAAMQGAGATTEAGRGGQQDRPQAENPRAGKEIVTGKPSGEGEKDEPGREDKTDATPPGPEEDKTLAGKVDRPAESCGTTGQGVAGEMAVAGEGEVATQDANITEAKATKGDATDFISLQSGSEDGAEAGQQRQAAATAPAVTEQKQSDGGKAAASEGGSQNILFKNVWPWRLLDGRKQPE